MQPQYHYISFTDDTPYRRFIQANQPDTEKHPIPDKTATTINTHGSYGPLLFHPKWKLKRKEILSRDMHRCIHCESNQELQVHHRQYHFIVSVQQFRLPWEYPDHLMITLCESCHSRGHSKYKVPTINV
jgi:hypothetical protein